MLQQQSPASLKSTIPKDKKPIVDLEKVGARGGGFGLQKGVFTQVTVEEARSSSHYSQILMGNVHLKLKQPD